MGAKGVYPQIFCTFCNAQVESTAMRRMHIRRGKRVYCNKTCFDRHQSVPVTKECETCKSEFTLLVHEGGKRRRFCSKACARKWVWSDPDRKSRISATIKGSMSKESREKSSARMKANNPTANPETREKMSRALKGRTFLARGGNGQLTVPQKALMEVLGWPAEYAIPTAPVNGMFPSLPNCYKVDIAHPDLRIAIEVDGRTHRQKKWRFLDKRKTEILAALGWVVIRFTNERVNGEIDSVVSEIGAVVALRTAELAIPQP